MRIRRLDCQHSRRAPPRDVDWGAQLSRPVCDGLGWREQAPLSTRTVPARSALEGESGPEADVAVAPGTALYRVMDIDVPS